MAVACFHWREQVGGRHGRRAPRSGGHCRRDRIALAWGGRAYVTGIAVTTCRELTGTGRSSAFFREHRLGGHDRGLGRIGALTASYGLGPHRIGRSPAPWLRRPSGPLPSRPGYMSSRACSSTWHSVDGLPRQWPVRTDSFHTGSTHCQGPRGAPGSNAALPWPGSGSMLAINHFGTWPSVDPGASGVDRDIARSSRDRC